MNDEYGSWDAISVAEAVEIFSSAPFNWWITGGQALELHLGRSWRDHDDTDISFRRVDGAAVRRFLLGWHISVATEGVLSPWFGEPLSANLHQNNLWCKKTLEGTWCLDLTVSDGDDDEWIFRRDISLRVPWDQAVLRSPKGIPYLAPELQLLYKSKDRRTKDDFDAAEVIPQLDIDRRNFLQNALPDQHAWRQFL